MDGIQLETKSFEQHYDDCTLTAAFDLVRGPDPNLCRVQEVPYAQLLCTLNVSCSRHTDLSDVSSWHDPGKRLYPAH